MKERYPKLRAVIRAILLIIYLLLAIVPLYWIFVTSIKGSKHIFDFPLVYFPKEWSFEGYKKLFSFSNFGLYFRNSLLVAVISSFAAMMISVLSGFALSRYKEKKMKRSLELLLYFSQTIPPFIIMVPIFTIFSQLKLTNSLVSLSFVYVATVVAFSTIMSKSFFDKVPSSIEEACMIDGCTQIQALQKVILPITLPGMAAIFCFAFINIWNELFLAVMLLMTNTKMTVPVALNSFISKAGISWDVMSAGIIIALLPTMIVFGFGQKYIVAGLTEGSVKE
jgi:multiple sugar transport system permease protein